MTLKLLIFAILLASSDVSRAKETKTISEIIFFNRVVNITHQWRNSQAHQFLGTDFKLTTPFLLAGTLCFIAASISSAGGIGGGGLFIPTLSIIAGLDLKTASSFSAFMVTGGSIANVACHMFVKSPKHGKKGLIDFDIALLSEPCMLLGVNIGVICNRVLPEWFITILFAIFLAWSTFKTCKSGFFYWKLETESAGVMIRENGSESNPLLSDKEADCRVEFPWKKLGMLVLTWFCFLFLYLLKGNRYGQGIIQVAPCGVIYWIISSLPIPVAIVITKWMLWSRIRPEDDAFNQQEIGVEIKNQPTGTLIFPAMALFAGVLGGLFGIGGGMLISPLLLQVGVEPEVTAATCSFMVFFSSTMSAIQYLLLGMKHTYYAIIFSVICFVGSLIGLVLVQNAITKHGRASIIVFSVATVMALSTFLMTTFGAVDVWRDYTSGKSMGFKLPC